jgi:hypothetical protein
VKARRLRVQYWNTGYFFLAAFLAAFFGAAFLTAFFGADFFDLVAICFVQG